MLPGAVPARLCGVLLALLALLGPTLASAHGADEPRCTCRAKNACYHYLRAPVRPPDDPCGCRKCEEVSRHDGVEVPRGWHRPCFALANHMDCFLRRHAASWRFTCSACLEQDDCCSYENQDRCPACGPDDLKDRS